MRWRVILYNTNDKNFPKNKRYGLKSLKTSKQIKELTPFENDINELVSEIKFRKTKTVSVGDSKKEKQPPEVIYRKGVLKNFANLTGKHLCWRLFLIKFQACSFY